MNKFKYDTHIHTSEVSNCGKVPAKEMVRLYKNAGYSGVVVTDHYYKGYFERLKAGSWNEKVDRYLEGYRIAQNEGDKLGLRIIAGMEITFPENMNDYLVYGIDEKFLKENKELYHLGLEGFRKLLEGRDILLFQAHPFRQHMTRALPELLDGVEVYNGNPRHDSRNPLALEYAEKNGLRMLSGSDFHQREDLARGGIIVAEEINSSAQLVDLIRNGRILELIRS